MKNYEEFQQHVISCYPQEACGVVVNDTYYPTENVHSDPVNYFKFSEAAEKKVALLQEPYKILHSHTMESFTLDPRIPSEEDMIGQKVSGVPWGIVHCDGANVSNILWFGPPSELDLVGRSYIPNVQDCFTLTRDYFWKEFKKDIGSHPRPADWESWNPHYISQTYAQLGFEQINTEEKGDVLLFAIGSRTINHIGIYLGSGLFVHHLYNRTSSLDTLAKWHRQHVTTLRFNK